MKTIDVESVIAKSGLEKSEVARQLFPNNKYPELSLNRVLKGKNNLDSAQISKLALLAGVDISQLFESKTWKNTANKKDVSTFTKGDYIAELNTDTWTTKVFHKGSLFHEFVLTSKAMTLSEYFNYIDSIINNFNSKSNV